MNAGTNGDPGTDILMYQTEDGKTRVEVRLIDETVWLSQKQMSVLFQKDVRTINEHIKNIFKEGELSEDSVIRNFRTTEALAGLRIRRTICVRYFSSLSV